MYSKSRTAGLLCGSKIIVQRVSLYFYKACTAVGAMPYCLLKAEEKCDWFLNPTWV